MPHVLAADYTPLSAVDIFVKDLGLVLDTARASKFPLPLASTAHQMFMQASSGRIRARGRCGGDQDLPWHHAAAEEDMSMARLLLGASPTISPAPPISPTRWCAAACARVQTIGVPDGALDAEVDAVVVALKSRTIAAAEAVAQSLAALRWLQRAGRRAVLFQVLLDLRLAPPKGNIGPVTDALLRCAAARAGLHDRLPGVPDQRAHRLQGPPVRRRRAAVSDSGMRHHPLTPMTDANLVRVLQAQTRARSAWSRYDGGGAGRGGDPRALRRAARRRRRHRDRRCDHRRRPACASARRCADTAAGHRRLGRRDRPAAELRARGCLGAATPTRSRCRAVGGRAAVLSGSCSLATNAQVRALDPGAGPAGAAHRSAGAGRRRRRGRARRCAWATPQLARDGPVLVYATADARRGARRCRRELGVAARRRAGRARARAHRDRARRARRAPPGGGRRRDLGRGGAGAGRARSSRSARRSIRACRGPPRARRRRAANGCIWR